MGLRESWLQLYKDREKMRQMGMLEAQTAIYGTPQERQLKAEGLLGSPGWEQSGPMQPGVERGDIGASGLLGSDMGFGDKAKFYIGMLGAGFDPAEAKGAIESGTYGINAPTLKERFSMEQDLSKQRTAMLKPYMEQRQAAQKTMTSLAQRTGAGDLAAVISFNKSLDPSSVVRESEQKAVTGVAGPIERFRSLLQDVEGAGSLTDTTRAQLASLIEEIQTNAAEYANNIVTDFEQRAEGYSLDPASIRGGQLGYDAKNQPISRFSSVRAPETILNAQQRARMELRRRGEM